MKITSALRRPALGSLLCALTLALPAAAVDVAGVKLDDTAKVAGKELTLNGAGVRVRAIFKVYAMGLYLTEKRKTPAEVLALDGPRRFTLVMMRDVSGADFGEAFMSGLSKNSDKAETSKLASQMAKFGEVLQNAGDMKKGDTLISDWIPGSGMVMQLNGKPLSEPIPDIAFYNAVLRIWLGDKPVDSDLKPALLGGKS